MSTDADAAQIITGTNWQ